MGIPEDDSGSVGIGYQILSLDDFIILLGEYFVNPFLKIFVKILESDFSRRVDLAFLTSLSVIIIPQTIGEIYWQNKQNCGIQLKDLCADLLLTKRLAVWYN